MRKIVTVGDPGQWIVATYVFSGCVSPLNFAVTMQDVIAGTVICLIAQIVFTQDNIIIKVWVPRPQEIKLIKVTIPFSDEAILSDNNDRKTFVESSVNPSSDQLPKFSSL